MPPPLNEIPKTLQEAVDSLVASLGTLDKKAIRDTNEEDLVELHFGLGTIIREAFRLWHANKDLLRSCGSETMHPKDATMVIIEPLWRRLQTGH